MRKKQSLSELKKKFPSDITFEFMTKQFLLLARDRYPSADKCLQLSNTVLARANLKEPILIVQAKIMVLSHFRDVVRKVDPNYAYHSIKQRDEVYAAIIEALESLEEELAEIEEQLYEDDLLEDDEEEEEGEELPFDT